MHDHLENRAQPSGPRHGPVTRGLNLVLIIICSAAVIYISAAVLTKPITGAARLFFLPFFLCGAIAINRMLAAVQIYRRKRKFSLLVRSGMGMMTLAVPIICFSLLNHLSVEIEKKRIANQFAPLIGKIEAAQRQAGKVPQDIAVYLDALAPLAFTVSYYPSADRFVLKTTGHSADIDGAVVFYDSASVQWYRVHNDLLAADPPSALGKFFIDATAGCEKLYRYDRSHAKWVSLAIE